MDGPDVWATLGKRARARRVALGHRHQTHFAKASGISIRIVTAIENGDMTGRKSYDPATVNLLETGLRWAPGSVDRILAGGDPIELAPPAPPGSALTQMGSAELVAGITERLTELVRRLPNEPNHTGRAPILIAGVNAPHASEVPGVEVADAAPEQDAREDDLEGRRGRRRA